MRCGSALLWAAGKKPMADIWQTCAHASEIKTLREDQAKARARVKAKAAPRSPTPAPPKERGGYVPSVSFDTSACTNSAWPNGKVPQVMRVLTLDTGKITTYSCPPKQKKKLTGRARRRAIALR